MSARQTQPVTITRLRGRDGSTVSTSTIPADKAAEMLNVDLFRATFARKRAGSSERSTSHPSGELSPSILSLGTTVSADLGVPETRVWMSSATQLRYIFPNGVTPITATITLNCSFDTQYVVFDNRTYISSASDRPSRLMVYAGDPYGIRFTGMSAPAAPAAVNTGSGSYPATLRYYRCRFAELASGVVVRMGEASPSTPATPSGSGSAARVFKPGFTVAPFEQETHWRVEVSLDNAVWYVLSDWLHVIGAPFYDDSADTTTYVTHDAAPLAGEFTNWQDMTTLSTDGNRLIGATGKTVYWSPVKGTTSASYFDSERVPDTVVQKNYEHIVGDGDDGDITAISLPFLGAMWVFKRTAIHRLTNTFIDTAAYARTQVYAGTGIGATHWRTLVYSSDQFGNQSLYFLSARGPYRISAAGLEYLGEDIRDIWDTVSVPTSGGWHGCADPDRHQIWWWVATNGSTYVNKKIVFDTRLGMRDSDGVVRGGWTIADGDGAKVYCASVAPSDISGADPYAVERLVPWMGMTPDFGPVLQYRDDTATTDNGTAFQGLVTLPDRHYAGQDNAVAITGASVVGSTGAHALTLTLTGEYGTVPPRTFEAAMAATGTETKRRAVFEGAALAEGQSAVGVSVGDATAAAFAWTMDELRLHAEKRESVIP